MEWATKTAKHYKRKAKKLLSRLISYGLVDVDRGAGLRKADLYEWVGEASMPEEAEVL